MRSEGGGNAPFERGKTYQANPADRIPHCTYAEPFVRMGGIFLRRSMQPKCEVINDLGRDTQGVAFNCKGWRGMRL